RLTLAPFPCEGYADQRNSCTGHIGTATARADAAKRRVLNAERAIATRSPLAVGLACPASTARPLVEATAGGARAVPRVRGWNRRSSRAATPRWRRRSRRHRAMR